MTGRTLNLLLSVFVVVLLVFSGCDYGLDYQAASKYCKDKYTFVGDKIDKLESSELIKSNFQEDTDRLIIEPLKICYMASFICNLQCYNLDPNCKNSLYEANKYCDPAIDLIPEKF